MCQTANTVELQSTFNQSAEMMRRMHALLLTKQVSQTMQDILKSYLETKANPFKLASPPPADAILIRETFNESVDAMIQAYEAGTLKDEEIRAFYEAYRMPEFEEQIGLEREMLMATNVGLDPEEWLLTHFWTDGLIESVIPVDFINNFANSELSVFSDKPELTGRPTDYPCGLWSYSALFRSRLPIGLIERITNVFMNENLNKRLPDRLAGLKVSYEDIQDSKETAAGKVYRCRLTLPVTPKVVQPIAVKEDTLPFETVRESFSEDNGDAELQEKMVLASKAMLDRYMAEKDESMKSVIRRDFINLKHSMEMRPFTILQAISGPLEDQYESEYGEFTRFSNYVIEDITYAVVTELTAQQLSALAECHGYEGWPVKTCECLVTPNDQDGRGFYKLTLTNAKIGAARLLLDL